MKYNEEVIDQFDLLLLTETEIVELIPELIQLKGVVENNPWHLNDDVFVHSMVVFNRLKDNLKFEFVENSDLRQSMVQTLEEPVGDLSRKQILLLAALLHDIAKPETFEEEDGVTRCPNHETKGAEKLAPIAAKLLANSLDQEQLINIVGNHNMPHDLIPLIGKSPEYDLNQVPSQYRKIFLELVLLGISDTEASQLAELIPDEFAFRIGNYHRLLNKKLPF